jgi:hypothetical protein
MMSSNSSKAPTQRSESPPGPQTPLLAVEYHDGFLSKRMRCRILSPQYAQVDAPLHIMETAAARLHLPRGYAVVHQQARLPSAYMRVSLLPAQLQRAAIGFTCAASHALAITPASVRVDAFPTRRWGTCILVRMMGGLIVKIQVGTACRARCFCAARCLTRSAANSGGLQGSVPRVPSPRVQGARPLCPLLPFGSAMQSVPISSVAHRL